MHIAPFGYNGKMNPNKHAKINMHNATLINPTSSRRETSEFKVLDDLGVRQYIVRLSSIVRKRMVL